MREHLHRLRELWMREPAVHPARAWALGGAAFLWLFTGYAILIGAAGTNEAAPHTLMPTWLRVALWVIPAGIAAYAMLTRRGTTLAVVSLGLAPMVRIASYLWAWGVYVVIDGGLGSMTGWYIAISLHGPHVLVVVLVAYLTRDDPIRTAIAERAGESR